MNLWELLSLGINVLDTPGAFVRGSASGLTDLLQGQNPDFHFDDLNPANAQGRVYGRDLLRKWGLAGPEDTWGNFAGGMVTDVALDPITWGSAGAGYLAKMLGRGGAEAARAATSTSRALVPVERSLATAAAEVPAMTKAAAPAGLTELLGGRTALPALPAPTPQWYSRLEQAANAVEGNKFKTQSLANMLKKSAPEGVSQEEMDWVLRGMPSKSGVTTREEMLKHIGENQIRVEEKLMGLQPVDEAWNKTYHADMAKLRKAIGINDAWRSNLSSAQIWPENATVAQRLAGESRELTGATTPEELASVIDSMKSNLQYKSPRFVGEPPKWSQYATPGGENYRELLLKMPEERTPVWSVTQHDPTGGDITQYFPTAESARQYASEEGGIARKILRPNPQTNYHSAHWGDEPNVLAHVRFDERLSPKGERTLFIQEIQSDWHQAGAKQGYGRPAMPEPQKLGDSWVVGEGVQQHKITPELGRFRVRFPGATYYSVDTLDEAMDAAKKSLAEMLTQGVPNAPFKNDKWGELALKRMLTYAKDNGFERIAWNNGQLAAQYGGGGATGEAAAGIAAWYDKILPDMMTKLMKKHGVKMEVMPLQVGEEMHAVPSFRVPQSLKKEIASKGMPLLGLALPAAGMAGAGAAGGARLSELLQESGYGN